MVSTGNPADSVSGADFVFRALAAEGTSHVFCVPGGHNDPFLTPMTHTPGITTVVAAFEGGAAFMADGYARASGRAGAAFGIGGPGLFNMATALASSAADRVPVVAISGEVPTDWEGRGGFQDASAAELDDVAVMRPICGTSSRVESPETLPLLLRGTLQQAVTGRGPAHLSVPLDVQNAVVPGHYAPLPAAAYDPMFLDKAAAERALAGLVGGSGSVALLVGPGARHGSGPAALRAAAEAWQIPVATTLGAKGVLSEDHPLSLGVFGYGGTRWANELILGDELDYLIVVGSALSQRDTMQWNPKMLPARDLIQVDEESRLLGRTWPGAKTVQGAAAPFLQFLADARGDLGRSLEAGRRSRQELLARVRAGGTRDYDIETREDDRSPMHPARVIAEARRAFPDETVAVVDSGSHRAFAAAHWEARGPRRYLSATDIGPMGAAIPLTIGAATANPEVPHLCITSDGCMLMHGMELHTAVQHGIRMTLLVLNNGSYGNIWYRAHEMGPAESRLTDIDGIDWLGFGRSLGADGVRVSDPGELAGAFAAAQRSEAPFIIDARTDKTVGKPTEAWAESVAEWEDNI